MKNKINGPEDDEIEPNCEFERGNEMRESNEKSKLIKEYRIAKWRGYLFTQDPLTSNRNIDVGLIYI